MRVFESEVTYRLSVILSLEEEERYLNAFRKQAPVIIPELDGKSFIVDDISRYHWENAPKHSWHLSVHQAGITKENP